MAPPSIPVPAPESSSAEQTPDPLRSRVLPTRIGERYEVRALLGRGGMAAVYRVGDASGEPEVALKQLQLPANDGRREAIEGLFEREFRTLAELDHPRVIRVYAYGCDALGPYYTMELLDGGSLTDCAPLPWRDACALMHDICSSLSLLHVRRLVHRDVSPHNVRRTLDGRAKLIDFGAMAAMGPNDQVIGTPAFTAPEVVHRLGLDARTDLYSIGATLYFALTGRPAYPARSFAQLNDVWAQRPLAPSVISADIPSQLDKLVMSMLSLEPALRPRSASEVMLQLATLVGRDDDEHVDVSSAYLSTPSLVGRDELLQRFRRRAARVRNGQGGGLVIEGAAGMGRSRALEACALLGETLGLVVTRARGSAIEPRPFATAQRLTEQLARELPESCVRAASAAGVSELLFENPGEPAPTGPSCKVAFSTDGRATLQGALSKLWLQLARDHMLMIAIDDIERIDEPSAAWLATLAARLQKHRLLLVCSAPLNERDSNAALKLITERSARHTLAPLSAAQSEALLLSAFGDVPRVALLADRVYSVAGGNPRACMDLARHLIERGTISYEGGTWSMPVQLSVDELPATMDEAFAVRAAALSASARQLAELQALSSYGGLSQSEQREVLDTSDRICESARNELVEHGILVRMGDVYVIVNESWAAAFVRDLDTLQRSARHRVLGEFGVRTQRSPFASAYHLFCAGEAAAALDVLGPMLTKEADRPDAIVAVSAARVCEVLSLALTHAEALSRTPRELADIRRWLCMISVASDDAHYYRAAPGLLADLRRDSGLEDWHELTQLTDQGQRITSALMRANERHSALPEAERVYGVQEAIKFMVQYVVVSIAIGTRTLDRTILTSLPTLLEPFVMLSPLIDAIQQNALATRECGIEGRFEQARLRWQTVYERLADVPRDSLQYVDAIRSAIVYGLGCLEAARGLPSAADRAALLDGDPMQMVNAMYLRRVMRLQLGDLEGAERYRRRAELLSVQLNSRQMFTTMALVELAAYATARDLTGVREITERMTELAQRAPGWRSYQRIAQGCLLFLRGDLVGARQVLETVLAQCWPSEDEPDRSLGPMPMTSGIYLEVLIAQQAYSEAKEFGLRAIAACARADIRTVDEIERGLALAEAKLGDLAGGAARLDGLIARARAQGVEGLHLGTTYEARARIAIWAGDRLALEEYSKLTAREYRHGRSSPLGARYERLMSEARQEGILIQPALSAFETSTLGVTTSGPLASTEAWMEFAARSGSSQTERLATLIRRVAEELASELTHLFLVRPDASLCWVASHSAKPYGEAELACARECLALALDDDLGSTQVESEIGTDSGSISTDASGTLTRAILLTSSVHGDPRYVAVIVSNSPRPRAQGHPLLAALAAHLVQMGDTEGLSLAQGPV